MQDQRQIVRQPFLGPLRGAVRKRIEEYIVQQETQRAVAQWVSLVVFERIWGANFVGDLQMKHKHIVTGNVFEINDLV